MRRSRGPNTDDSDGSALRAYIGSPPSRSGERRLRRMSRIRTSAFTPPHAPNAIQAAPVERNPRGDTRRGARRASAATPESLASLPATDVEARGCNRQWAPAGAGSNASPRLLPEYRMRYGAAPWPATIAFRSDRSVSAVCGGHLPTGEEWPSGAKPGPRDGGDSD